MNDLPQILSYWAGIPAIFLLLAGSVFAVVGALGLLRLSNFYQRMHAATLVCSAATLCMIVSAMLFLHDKAGIVKLLLVFLFVAITASANTAILTKTAVYRDFRRARKNSSTLLTEEPASIFTGQREE